MELTFATAYKGWSSRLGIGRMVTNHPRTCYEMLHRALKFVSSLQHDNETSGSTKCGKFLGQAAVRSSRMTLVHGVSYKANFVIQTGRKDLYTVYFKYQPLYSCTDTTVHLSIASFVK
jgi:hypothetical protein